MWYKVLLNEEWVQITFTTNHIVTENDFIVVNPIRLADMQFLKFLSLIRMFLLTTKQRERI